MADGQARGRSRPSSGCLPRAICARAARKASFPSPPLCRSSASCWRGDPHHRDGRHERLQKDLFEKILGLNGHVVVYKVGERFTDYDPMSQVIAAVPGIVHAMPIVEGQVMVSSAVQALGGALRGIRETDLKSTPLVANNIQFGTLEASISRTASRLHAARKFVARERGRYHHRHLASGSGNPLRTAPRSKSYPIIAVFEVGMSEYDKTMMFMPLAEAQKYFSKNYEADVLEVVVSDPERIAEFAEKIRVAGGPTISVIDWRQRNETFFTVLEVERNVMFIILSLIVLVAGPEHHLGPHDAGEGEGRDIAILRTMGATKGALMRVFIITGASIGILGALAASPSASSSAPTSKKSAKRSPGFRHAGVRSQRLLSDAHACRFGCRRNSVHHRHGHGHLGAGDDLSLLAGLPHGSCGSAPLRVR